MISISSDKATFRAGSHWVAGESGYPQLTATGGTGTIVWSDGGAGGEFIPATGAAVEYRPKNKTQQVTITADDDLPSSDTTPIAVDGTFPLNAMWGGEGSLDVETTEHKAKGGKTRYYREEDVIQLTEQLDVEDVEIPEVRTFQAFWRDHRKVTPFYFYDTDLEEVVKVRFTSEIRWRKTGGASKSMFANVRGEDDITNLDTEKPTTQILTPVAGVVSGLVPFQTAVADNVGIDKVEFFVDGALITTLYFPAWRIVWDSTTVANGARTLKVTATDLAGNVSLDTTVIVTVSN